MVKERKPQTGATNLTARSSRALPPVQSSSHNTHNNTHTDDNNNNEETVTATENKQLTRSVAHKLLAPDLYASQKSENSLNLNKTATWTPLDVYQRDFETIHKESFRDPSSFQEKAERTVSTLDIARETIKKRDEVEAINNMCKLVRASYGTVATMLRSFHKKSGDSLSLYEFGEYLKRNKLDSYLPHTDRERIFDHVDAKHGGEVAVKDFLKKVEEYEFLGQEHNADLQKVRDFLELQLQEARVRENRLTGDSDLRRAHDAELERLKQTKGVENEVERMRKALGMKTFSLEFHPEEFEDAVNNPYGKAPLSQSQRKYARFLQHSNLKLSAIPFYENRTTEIDRLKARAVNIDRTLESDSVLGRFEELSRTRWLSSAATYDPERFAEMARESEKVSEMHQARVSSPSPWREEESGAQSVGMSMGENETAHSQRDSQRDTERVMSLSRSLPNLAIRPSPLAQSLPPSLSLASLPNNTQTQTQTQQEGEERQEASSYLQKPQMSLSPVKPKARSAVSLSLLTDNADTRNEDATSAAFSPGLASASVSASADDASALLSKVQLPPSLNGAKSVASLVASLSASKKSKPVSKLRAGLLDQEEKKLQPSDFFTQIIDESSPMGRLKNPSAVFRIEKIDPNVYQPSCRRAKQHAPTDWSRVGVGGLTESGKTHSGDAESEEFDPYKSTQSLHYPPLRYEPSQPVSRDLISDAERDANHRAFKRSERYARKMANLEVTKTRLEYEALQKEIRAMRRQQSRIEDNIRYKTNVLLQDLQAFRTLPLQRMAKRQNIELAERMWAGSHDKTTVQLVPDDRDFRSTYNASFDANVVKETIRSNAQTINDRLHGTTTAPMESSMAESNAA